MLGLYLDPFLLSCPSLEKSAPEFSSRVNNVLNWYTELKEFDWLKVYITNKTQESLVHANAYPDWNKIQAAIKRFGINYIQTKDIFRLLSYFIDKSIHIEHEIGIREILLTGNSANPSDHLDGRHPVFIETHDRLLIMMHLKCFFTSSNQQDQILITCNLRRDCDQIEIAGEVVEVEFCDSGKSNVGPYSVRETFDACNNVDGFLCIVNPTEIWKTLSSRELYEKALKVYLHKRGIDHKQYKWTFGNYFLESVIETGFHNTDDKIERLLRACAETILKTNLEDTHALRVGSGPADAQIRRSNGDGAWRRDIDHEYHLHYWETSKGAEFSNVVTHNNMAIDE